MKRNSKIEDEIDEIRLRIYEETKDMTSEQRVERSRRISEELSEKYGFKIAPRTE